jgi:predicted kinase
MPKLYLLRGCPGSGKSTLANALAYTPDVFHVEADQYFFDDNGNYNFDINKIGHAHKWCQDVTTRFLKEGYDVVVSNTFTTKKELKPYFEIAANYGIIPQVIVCQNEFQNIHSVPEETLRKMKARFTYDISSLFETEPNLPVK